MNNCNESSYNMNAELQHLISNLFIFFIFVSFRLRETNFSKSIIAENLLLVNGGLMLYFEHDRFHIYRRLEKL